MNFKVLVGINVIIGIVSFISLALSSIIHMSERFLNSKDYLHDQHKSRIELVNERVIVLETLNRALNQKISNLKVPLYLGVLESENFMNGATWKGSPGIEVTGIVDEVDMEPIEKAFKFTFTTPFESPNDYVVFATPVMPGRNGQHVTLSIFKGNADLFYIQAADPNSEELDGDVNQISISVAVYATNAGNII